MRKFSVYCLIAIPLFFATCAASPLNKQTGFYDMPAPIGSRIIKFPSAGFQVKLAQPSRPYYYYTNERTGMNISFIFDRADRCKSSKACSQFVFNMQKKGGNKLESDWNTFQEGEIFVSEYMIKKVEGVDLMQHNMNVHYVFDGIWLDVHISKARFRESDRKLFLDLIHSIKIE